jgi:hypothetical protein
MCQHVSASLALQDKLLRSRVGQRNFNLNPDMHRRGDRLGIQRAFVPSLPASPRSSAASLGCPGSQGEGGGERCDVCGHGIDVALG